MDQRFPTGQESFPRDQTCQIHTHSPWLFLIQEPDWSLSFGQVHLAAATWAGEQRFRTHSPVLMKFTEVFDKDARPRIQRQPSQNADDIGARLGELSSFNILMRTTGVPKCKIDGSLTTCGIVCFDTIIAPSFRRSRMNSGVQRKEPGQFMRRAHRAQATAVHGLPRVVLSMSRRAFFRFSPPAYPTSVPSDPMTLWQGMASITVFRAMAEATGRMKRSSNPAKRVTSR